MPLQWLAETGLVGAVLAIAALVLLLAAGVRRGAGRPARRAQSARSRCSPPPAAYAVHCLYDWDWDIPAVTLPVLFALGVLSGSIDRAGRRTGPGVEGALRRRQSRTAECASTRGGHCLCLVALSAALPSNRRDAGRRRDRDRRRRIDHSLTNAATAARLAARLDPLSDAGHRAEATIALRQGQPHRARAIPPRRCSARAQRHCGWGNLAYVELALGDAAAGRRAAQRALELDPRGTFTGTLPGAVAAAGTLRATPPQGSASSVSTP